MANGLFNKLVDKRKKELTLLGYLVALLFLCAMSLLLLTLIWLKVI